MSRRPPLWTRDFVLTCATAFCFFASLHMQTPVFPSFLRERAGATSLVIGLFLGMFNLSGVLLRPTVGRALARHSRRRFMMLGTATTTVASLLYLASPSLAFLLPLRLAHGFAVAAYYTAATTLVADISPDDRRGEAISYFSMFLYLGLAGGPALGLWLASTTEGFPAVFIASAALGTTALVCASRLREPALHGETSIEAERHPLVNRRALFPGAVLALAAVGYAAALGFTADFAQTTGIQGRALFFPVLAGSVVVVRLTAGTISDRFGRLAVAGPGLALFAGSVLLESTARGPMPLIAAAAGAGIGFGFFFPAMMAFTIDRVRPVERASAMGTFTGAFDLGFGLGAPILGGIRQAFSYPAMYRGASLFAWAGVVVLAVGRSRSRRTAETAAEL